ncbi:A24 family peptidase [Corynebacterium sp. H78]|uniref:A24 family peptidase n=1 Tax=Corynebacterium sp. H78 TaxID=3133417 RepID=UPI00309556D9
MGSGLLCLMGLVWALSLCWYDFRYRRLPDSLTLIGGIGALIVSVVEGDVRAAIAGGVVWALLYAGIAVVKPQAMGGGDIKLAVTTGALVALFGSARPGWETLLAVFLAIALAGVITGTLGIMMWGTSTLLRPRDPTKMQRIGHVPHGPGMLLATALLVLPV